MDECIVTVSLLKFPLKIKQHENKNNCIRLWIIPASYEKIKYAYEHYGLFNGDKKFIMKEKCLEWLLKRMILIFRLMEWDDRVMMEGILYVDKNTVLGVSQRLSLMIRLWREIQTRGMGYGAKRSKIKIPRIPYDILLILTLCSYITTSTNSLMPFV